MSAARERERGNGTAPAGAPRVAPTGERLEDRNLNMLLGDFARVLGCDLALVGARDGGGEIASSWGMHGTVAIEVPENGGRRWPAGRFGRGSAWGRAGRAGRGGGFVGRALAHGRPAFESLESSRDAELIGAAGVALTHAIAVPVQRPGVVGARLMLVGGFSTPPEDLDRAFWLATSYARLIGLLVRSPDALDGLLGRSGCDGLTGCLTYERVMEELLREVNHSARAAVPLSCCFIDLDRFKRVNDEHGHLRGNEVLAEVGLALREGVRSCDAVGRYGGDEFIAILPHTTEADAVQLAGRLRAKIARRQRARFDELLTASIGVAQWTAGSPVEELLARADSALFAAKSLPGGVAADSEATRSQPEATGR